MSKKQKRVLVYSSPLVLLVIAVVGGMSYFQGLQKDATRLAETGRGTIDMLKAYMVGLEKNDIDEVMSFYDDGYVNEDDGRWMERLVSTQDGISVYDWSVADSQKYGKTEVRGQIQALLDKFNTLQESKLKLDTFEEFISDDEMVARAFLWLRGTQASQEMTVEEAPEVIESLALFRLHLKKAGTNWKIQKQELIYGKTVTGDRSGFTDITAEAGIDFVTNHNPSWFTPEWEPKKFGIIKFGSAGVATADYDNDGWYDLFFGDGKHPRLYRNQGDGTFADVTAAAGLPTEMLGINVAVFADFDNDGDKDLFLGCGTDQNRLYRNEGDGTFSDVTEGSGIGGILVTVAAAADYDNDGKTDLYLGRYLDPRVNLPTTLFFTRNSEGNSLLHNEGSLKFKEVTEQAGVRNGGLTLGVTWGDYDNDGDQDLYVANDFGKNDLYRNQGDGTFTDVSTETGTHDFGFGMSASFGDVDNDGDLDLYVSNVHSGQRWFGQSSTLIQYLINSVEQGTIVEDFPSYKEIFSLVGMSWASYGDKMVKGNSLLINDGKGHFTDISEATNTNPFGWFWGSTFFDYDNDGKKDILAVNGWVTANSHEDL